MVGHDVRNAMRLAFILMILTLAAGVPALRAVASDDRSNPKLPDKVEAKPVPCSPLRKIDGDFATALAFSPNGKVLAVGDGEIVRFVNPRTGKIVAKPWSIRGGLINIISFVDDSTVVVVAAPNSTLSIREYPSGKETHAIKLDKQFLNCLATDTGMILGGGPDFIYLWTGPQWGKKWAMKLTDNNRRPIALAIAPNRQEFAAGTSDMGVEVYRLKDGKWLGGAGYNKHVLASIRAIAYSPDSTTLAVAPVAATADPRRPYEAIGVAVYNATLTKTRATFAWPDAGTVGKPMRCVFTPGRQNLDGCVPR